jgi:hypothetical protein
VEALGEGAELVGRPSLTPSSLRMCVFCPNKQVGDVLGVLLELEPAEEAAEGGNKGKGKGKKTENVATGNGNGGGRISYFLNGKPLGAAFEALPLSSSAAGTGQDGDPPTLVRYYPALSLDEGEALRVNIGSRPFAFPQCLPSGAKVRPCGRTTMRWHAYTHCRRIVCVSPASNPPSNSHSHSPSSNRRLRRR